MLALLPLALLAVAAIVGTFVEVARDGYGRIPATYPPRG